jgi:hypothetical protein
METTGMTRALRVVRPDETDSRDCDQGHDAGFDAGTLSTEDYWARVQALRADRERLRPAN